MPGMDWDTLRRQFAQQFEEDLMYLNVGALGPLLPPAAEQAETARRHLEKNPALYGYEYLQGRMEEVRQKGARFLGCNAENIVITNSTTDGLNAVAQGLGLRRGQCVITTNQEHPGGRMCWEHLKQRYQVKIVTINLLPTEHDPALIVERFRRCLGSIKKLNGRPPVISISHVTATTGLRMPIKALVQLGRENGCVCVVDGAQAVGAVSVNVVELGCHAYATCGHKWLMGPKGTGLLYLSNDAERYIQPLCLQDQDHKREVYSHSTGMRDIPAVLGLGAALDCLTDLGMQKVEQHAMFLRNYLYEKLKSLDAELESLSFAEGLRLKVISPPPDALLCPPVEKLASPMLSFTLPRQVKNEVFAQKLYYKHRIFVKCVPNSIHCSIKPDISTQVNNGIRISPHLYNTVEEIDRLSQAIRQELLALLPK